MRPFGSALPWQTEMVLIREIQGRSSASAYAEERLVASYRPLVMKRVRQIGNRHAVTQDLRGDMEVAGETAVCVSARRFRLNNGNKFFPFVDVAIHGAVWIAALEGFSAMEIPRAMLREAVAIRRAYAEAGAQASIECISEIAGVTQDRVKLLLSASNHAMPLSEALEIPDVLVDDEPPMDVESSDWRAIKLEMANLSEIERDCVGSVICEMEPPQSVADRHSLNVWRVKRIAEDCLTRLRETIGEGGQRILPGLWKDSTEPNQG